MKKLLTFGLFLAAGYGTYEILRRAGLLEKAGQWLQDNVPEDVKSKIRDHVQQAKDGIQTARDKAGEQYGSLKDRATDGYGQVRDRAQQFAKTAGEQYDHAKQAVTNKLHGGQPATAGAGGGGGQQANAPVADESDSAHSTDASAIGQTITGPGRGTDDATTEVNGGTVHHRVGRGVVHG